MFWLILVMKVPIAALLYIVWWAIREPPVPEPDSGDGGAGSAPIPTPACIRHGPRAAGPTPGGRRARPAGPAPPAAAGACRSASRVDRIASQRAVTCGW